MNTNTPKAKVEPAKEPVEKKSDKEVLDEQIQARFNIGATDYKAIGPDRDRIVEHLEKNTHVDPKIARQQVDEFFDGPKAKSKK